MSPVAMGRFKAARQLGVPDDVVGRERLFQTPQPVLAGGALEGARRAQGLLHASTASRRRRRIAAPVPQAAQSWADAIPPVVVPSGTAASNYPTAAIISRLRGKVNIFTRYFRR